MNCAERKDLSRLHAFDQLEPAEAAILVTHVARGCPLCAGELAAAAAALAASITTVAVLIPARRAEEALKGELSAAEVKLRSMGSPATRVAALEAMEPQMGASGRLFWDESKSTWHVFVSDMKQSADGRVYELWFITVDQRKVPAGLFVVGAGGDAAFDVPLPKDLGALALAAVTEAPEGGVPQPTGAIQLVGKLGT